jgi:V-type ATPase 116kDa subunit family
MHEVLNELVEYKIVLEKAYTIIHGMMRGVNESQHTDHDQSYGGGSRRQSTGSRRSIGFNDLEDNKAEDPFRSQRLDSSFREVSIRYVSGTIEKDDVMRFKRILFRASRGKVLQYFEDIETPLKDFHGKLLMKVVYVLVFEEGSHFKEKVAKICDSF